MDSKRIILGLLPLSLNPICTPHKPQTALTLVHPSIHPSSPSSIQLLSEGIIHMWARPHDGHGDTNKIYKIIPLSRGQKERAVPQKFHKVTEAYTDILSLESRLHK